MTGRLLGLLVLTGVSLGLPFDLHWPTWVERWLYNPRERTAKSLAAYQEGDFEGAVPFAATAQRLAPEDPLALYNAGTAHLAAGSKKGLKLLEEAAASAPSRLAPDAHYNLGNARLQARDPAGAVAAYKTCLKAQPDHADAKFNLELALRELERERLEVLPPRESPQGDRQGEEEQSQNVGGDEPSSSPPGTEEPAPAHDPGEEGDRRETRPEAGETPVPFQEQPELTAEQAAALLEAVENLERQQRRAEAARRTRQRAGEGKDW